MQLTGLLHSSAASISAPVPIRYSHSRPPPPPLPPPSPSGCCPAASFQLALQCGGLTSTGSVAVMFPNAAGKSEPASPRYLPQRRVGERRRNAGIVVYILPRSLLGRKAKRARPVP